MKKYHIIYFLFISIGCIFLVGCTTWPTNPWNDLLSSPSRWGSPLESLRSNHLLRIGQYTTQYLPISKSLTPPQHALDRQGWWISLGSGRILTAGHLIDDPLQRYAVQTSTIRPNLAPLNHVRLLSGDLALATISTLPSWAYPLNVRNAWPALLNTYVYILNDTIQSGTISRIETGYITITTDTPLMLGMSGSPVVTASGELLAILTAISNQEENISYATLVRSILSWEVSPDTIE